MSFDVFNHACGSGHDDESSPSAKGVKVKICKNGVWKPQFALIVKRGKNDTVIKMKESILNKILYQQRIELTPVDFAKQIRQLRLFGVTGIELHDHDYTSSSKSGEHFFYSFGETFDYQVCIEFYEMREKIGEGGFGQVHLAWDKVHKCKVAIKMLSVMDHPLSPNLVTKEIEALAKLKHRHIVKLLAWFPLPKEHKIVLVMEYLEGGELYEYWKSKPEKRLSEQEAKEVMVQLLSAIEYCHHNKIIHRDLKFQNILLSRKPEQLEQQDGVKTKYDFGIDLKVVDFGIFGSTHGLNPEKVQAGSLKYMAPELLQGHTQSDPAIDVWSMGIILYGLVTGEVLFYRIKLLIFRSDLLCHFSLHRKTNYARLSSSKSQSLTQKFLYLLNAKNYFSSCW